MVNKTDAGWTPEDEAFLMLQRELGFKYRDIAGVFPSGAVHAETACWSRYNYITKPEARQPVVKKPVKFRPDYAREILIEE